MMTSVKIKYAMVAASLSALSLAGVSAWISVNGMAVFLPGDPGMAIWLGVSLQATKLTSAAWLSHRWVEIEWLHRILLLAFILLIAVINIPTGYSYLLHTMMTKASTIKVVAEMLHLSWNDEVIIGWVVAVVVSCTDWVAVAVLPVLFAVGNLSQGRAA